MASKTAKMRKQEDAIKQAIVRGHRNGVCDSDGNSIAGGEGINIAKPRPLGSTAKTYVYRNGKMVQK
jgi:hypothetical protein